VSALRKPEDAVVTDDVRSDQTQTSQNPETSLSLFAGLDQATTTLVVEHLTEEVFPAGHVVFEDNAPGDTLYIIKSGLVQVSKTLDNGQEHVLAELGPGEFFGEMALLEEKPRSARVSTRTSTRLLAMSRQTFNTLIERHPVVAANFLKSISARLRRRNHEQDILLREKQVLVEELAAKNAALECALAELRAAMATVAEHERVKRDLEIAREIQRQMLPADFPQLPGLQLHATTVPSRWVGGDFYDAVPMGRQCIGLLLGDVSGKGIPAAMQMARLMGEFRACVSHRADPTGVLEVLNELLCQRNTQWTSFVTVQYLVLDLARRHLRFVCAGHPPILLCHANGQIERLGSLPNLPLGIENTFTYRQEEHWLRPDDRLLLYSDGTYELQNAQGEMFGISRLAESFAAAPASPAAAIAAIQAALNAFSDVPNPHDDTTLLCAHVA
jgi:sigma-B regulation protein RsbU (phosphoserine phosphatase)